MNRPVMIRDLPTAGVDLLGAEDGSNYILANAALAEKISASDEAETKKAAMGLEDEQLLELASPAKDLLAVVDKLAMAVRLAGWTLDSSHGYTAPLTALLGSALSDLIVLRHAEMRRRELLAEPLPARQNRAGAGDVLGETRGLLRTTAGLLAGLSEQIAGLEAARGREPTP